MNWSLSLPSGLTAYNQQRQQQDSGTLGQGSAMTLTIVYYRGGDGNDGQGQGVTETIVANPGNVDITVTVLGH